MKEYELNTFFFFLQNIKNNEVKNKVEEMFFYGNIDDLDYENIKMYIDDISKLNPTIEDLLAIESIFKSVENIHYYHKDYGFVLMMWLSRGHKINNQLINTKTYLLKNTLTGHYKIGKTSKLKIEDRVKQLAVGAKIEIVSFCNIDIEKKLHNKYSIKRVFGEWFNLSKEEVLEITELFNSRYELEVQNGRA